MHTVIKVRKNAPKCLAILILASLYVTGCASLKQVVGPGPLSLRNLTPIEIIPIGAVAVLRVDASQLRKSPYYAPLHTLLQTSASVGPINPVFGPLLDTVDDVYVGSFIKPSPEAPKTWIAVVRGNALNRESLETLLLGANANRSNITRTDHKIIIKSFTLSSSASGDLLQLDSRTWVYGRGIDIVKTLKDAFISAAKTFIATGVFKSMAQRSSFEQSTFGWLWDTTRAPNLIPELSLLGLRSAMIEKVQWMGAHIDVGSRLGFEAIADTKTPGQSNELESVIRSRLGSTQRNIAVMLLGLAPVLQRVAVTAESPSRLAVGVQTTESEAKNIMERITGIRNLFSSVDPLKFELNSSAPTARARSVPWSYITSPSEEVSPISAQILTGL